MIRCGDAGVAGNSYEFRFDMGLFYGGLLPSALRRARGSFRIATVNNYHGTQY